VIFLRAALVIAAGLIGGGGPTKSLNDFSRGWGDVWIDLESGHQEGGIGVLEDVRTHDKGDKIEARFWLFGRQLCAVISTGQPGQLLCIHEAIEAWAAIFVGRALGQAIRTIYQTRHTFGGFIGVPASHENASANGRNWERGPWTLKRRGACGSFLARSRASSSVSIRHQT
jgi:hypothetical protein